MLQMVMALEVGDLDSRKAESTGVGFYTRPVWLGYRAMLSVVFGDPVHT